MKRSITKEQAALLSPSFQSKLKADANWTALLTLMGIEEGSYEKVVLTGEDPHFILREVDPPGHGED